MDYILYQDHIGWVIATEDDYELLQAIHRALGAQTWGGFLAALPDEERYRLVAQYRHCFAPDLLQPEGLAVDEEAEPIWFPDTPFDPGDLPAFSDGDYPPWPANIEQFSDAVCHEVYRRFGKRQSGFIHAFCHLPHETLDDVEAWLHSLGHQVVRRRSPSA